MRIYIVLFLHVFLVRYIFCAVETEIGTLFDQITGLLVGNVSYSKYPGFSFGSWYDMLYRHPDTLAKAMFGLCSAAVPPKLWCPQKKLYLEKDKYKLSRRLPDSDSLHGTMIPSFDRDPSKYSMTKEENHRVVFIMASSIPSMSSVIVTEG